MNLSRFVDTTGSVIQAVLPDGSVVLIADGDINAVEEMQARIDAADTKAKDKKGV